MDKHDYYYSGADCLEEGDEKKAKYYFKKAIEMDDEFVDAYNGMGTAFWWTNIKKSKEWFRNAYELTKKHFKNKWPEELSWGILENRQYLRSIHYYGLTLWRERKNAEALELFKLLLKLNKNDNQGVRYLVAAIYAGLSWDQMEDYCNDMEKEDKLLEEQNKMHNFWDWEDDD